MVSPSRPVLSASSLKISERSLVPSLTQSQGWVEKKCNLGFFYKVRVVAEGLHVAGLARSEPDGVSLLLELDGPSCEAFEEASSIDMLTCRSGKGCNLFGCGDCLGSGLGETFADGCSPAWSVLADGAEQSKEGNHPNKMW